MNQACHIYKSYYYFCDVLGSLAARYCFDFKTERKPHRVCFVCFIFTSIYLYIELGLHQMYRHAIINPYLRTGENKGRAGVDVKLCEHGLRAQLFDLVRAWTNECARSFVSFEYFHPMNAFEMETIPLIEKEYDKGHHTLMAAPGKIARSCVACGTATRYFCYGCSADAPTVVHCCSSSRDGGRDCFARLHRCRKPNHPGGESIYNRRRRASDVKNAERDKRRREQFKDPKKPRSRQLRGSKKKAVY